MSGIDDELRREVAQAEAGDPIPVVNPVLAPNARASKRSIGLLVGLLIAGGGVLLLVFTSFQGSAVYSKGVDELMRDRARLADRSVRVEGMLVKGTLVRRDQPCEYRFTIAKKGVELPVHYAQCIVPDTFRDMPGMDVAVTAEGKLSEAGHFEASHIMAKCPSKYEMKERAKGGERAPHSSMAPAEPPVAL
jgi:cytochrome c-type biogenesis protein CcmE